MVAPAYPETEPVCCNCPPVGPVALFKVQLHSSIYRLGVKELEEHPSLEAGVAELPVDVRRGTDTVGGAVMKIGYTVRLTDPRKAIRGFSGLTNEVKLCASTIQEQAGIRLSRIIYFS